MISDKHVADEIRSTVGRLSALMQDALARKMTVTIHASAFNIYSPTLREGDAPLIVNIRATL